MPQHDVDITIPTKSVVNADVIFEVASDGLKLGELRVSRGGVDWYPRNAKVPYKFTWEQFSRLLGTEAG
jgi:hypothetical protein